MSHCVIVTFGNTLRDQKYASGVTLAEADVLRNVAFDNGYRDAFVALESAFDAMLRKKAKERADRRQYATQLT